MNRRRLLASAGLVAAVPAAWYLTGPRIDLSDVDVPEPSGECGTAASQSEQFVDGGEVSCGRGRTSQLDIQNERDEEIDVRVDVEPVDGGEGAFSEQFQLSPGERVSDASEVEATADYAATVTVDEGDPLTTTLESAEPAEGDEGACNRRGISVTPSGVDSGFVEPVLYTPGGLHAGDPAVIHVEVRDDAAHDVALIVVDHCAETVHRETMRLSSRFPWSNAAETFPDLIVNGGMYDVIVAVDGGGEAVYEYHDDAWILHVEIDASGDVSIKKPLLY